MDEDAAAKRRPIMGDSAPAPNPGADGAQVDTHGTKRDFGNMLNAHIPKKKKLTKEFSPWMKIGGKK